MAPSITEKVPLLGADGYFALVNQTERVGAYYGLHPYRVRHLLDRYGSLIGEVLAMAEDKPDLLSPITDAPVYLKVEAVYAAAAEGALHLEDILARRMRISHRVPASRRGLRPRGRRDRGAGAGLGRSRHPARGRHLHRRGWTRRCDRSSSRTTSRPMRCGKPRPEARAEILEPVPLN